MSRGSEALSIAATWARGTVAAIACVGALLPGCAGPRPAPSDELRTGAERRGYASPTTAAEVVAFVDELAARSPHATATTIGTSAGGRPLRALVLARDPAALLAGTPEPGSLTFLVVGSQHGSEPSGTEAILAFARELARAGDGDGGGAFTAASFVLIPDSNPDGRDARRRVNANGVNLSTNYVTRSEPETRAVAGAIRRFRPDVVLDVHESALFKKSTLGAQGYLTDFEAQLEIANNPNVEPGIAALSLGTLLPETLARLNAAGLPAQRYLGEITDVRQPITHGGLSLKNLRNTAGMDGAVSFLVENRLDPAGPDYPTWRNFGARIAKQLLSLRTFVAVCRVHGDEIRTRVARARGSWRDPDGGRPVLLVASWAEETTAPWIQVPLRRLDDGELEQIDFARHTRAKASEPVAPPDAYVVTAHQGEVAEILDRHGVAYQRLAAPLEVDATVRRVQSVRQVPARHGWGYADYALEARRARLTLAPGSLWIPLRQPGPGRITLLLEPRSSSSLFQDAAWAPLVVPGEDFFVHRVERPREAAPS